VSVRHWSYAESLTEARDVALRYLVPRCCGASRWKILDLVWFRSRRCTVSRGCAAGIEVARAWGIRYRPAVWQEASRLAHRRALRRTRQRALCTRAGFVDRGGRRWWPAGGSPQPRSQAGCGGGSEWLMRRESPRLRTPRGRAAARPAQASPRCRRSYCSWESSSDPLPA